MRLVLDTNVLVAAFRSRRGASNALLRSAFEKRFAPLCSTALFLEYEAVLSREETRNATGHSLKDVQTIMDAFASIAEPVELSFCMRPMLKDSDDEMVLEAALNSDGGAIVTHNIRDFEPASSLGIEILRPGEVIRRLNNE